ncbi:hypothetical protein [Chlamydia suis]|uniref:hypothetical protein n=1 Tax=Chlamydia suis TaxID=83559 RepID=UPI0009B0E433|nr:hypothetical protein [Chlamydia suis]
MTNPAASLPSSSDLSLKDRLSVSSQLCTQAEQGDAQPLSPEARSLNSNFSTRRDLIDAVEKAISSAKGNELKKLKVYETALKILTVIGSAILFAVPLCMLLGVPLWIPIVVCIGAGIVFTVAKGCLRKRCQQIRQEYRALQLYYQYLLSNKDSIDGTLLSRFDVRLRRPEDKLHGVDFEKRAANHPIAADKNYDFAGLAHQRYQVDASVGISSVQDAFWRSAAQQVKSVKDEIISGEKTSADLPLISEQALQIVGVDLSGAARRESILDLAQSLLSMLAWGAQVGKDAQQSVQQYQMRFLGSPLLATWCGAGLSSAAQDFIVKGKDVLDVASENYKKLRFAIERVQLVPVLDKVRNWKNKIEALLKQKSAGAEDLRKLYREIESDMHAICLEDGVSSSLQKQVRLVTRKYLHGDLEEIFSKKNADLQEKDLARMQRSVCECANFVASLLENRMEVANETPIKEVEEKSYQELISTILQIGSSSGGVTPLVDNIHRAIRKGSELRGELSQAMKLHPERCFQGLQASVEKLQAFISDSKWGASAVHLSPQETLEQKHQFLAALTEIQARLADWRTRYGVFKTTKLNRIILADSIKGIEDFLRAHKTITESCSLELAIEELKSCENALKADVGNIEKTLDPAEIESAKEEFKSLLLDLAGIQELVNQISRPVYEEGMSGKRLLFDTLFSHPKTLQKKAKEKGAFLEALTKKDRLTGADSASSEQEGTLELISSGYDYLSSLLGKINTIEALLEESRGKEASSQNMQQLVSLTDELALELSSFRQDSMDSLVHRLEGLSALGSPVESVDLSTSPVAEKIANSSHQRIHKITQTKISRTLKGFTNLIKELRSSLRNAMLTKAVVAAILSIAFSCLAIALFSVQFTWIPIVFCVVALVLEAVPSALSIWIDRKNWKSEVASLAKELAVDNRKLPYPEIDVKNVKKLQKLRDVYGLDGAAELRVAEAALLGAEKLPEELKQDTLQSTIKALKADAQVLNKKFKSLPEQYQSQGTEKTVISAKLGDSGTSEIEKEIAAIEAKQEEYHAACFQFEAISSRFWAERHKTKFLESLLAQKRKDVAKLCAQEERYSQIVNRLEVLVARKNMLVQRASKEEVSTKMSELLSLNNRLMQAHANRNLDEDNSLHRQLQDQFNKLAEEGSLQAVKALLELNMCLGNAGRALYHVEQKQVSSEKIFNQNQQQFLQYSENLFASYDKADRTPLLRFILGPGWNVIREACAELKSLSKRWRKEGASLSSEDYEKACRALDRFLKARKEIRPELSLPFGDDKHEADVRLQHQIRKNLQIKTQVTIGYQESCRNTLLLLEDWIQKTRQESEDCRKVETAIQEFCQKEDPSKESSDALEALFSSLHEEISKIPVDVLRVILRSLSSKVLRIMDQRLELEKLEEKFVKADAVIKAKEAEFEQNGETWHNQYQLLNTQIEKLESRKRKLLEEKDL